MIIINLVDLIALCMGGVAILLILGVLLYAKISDWFYNKRKDKNKSV